MLLAALVCGATSFASERVIKTRDGKTFAKAEITEVTAAAVKIVHDGGITVVALENLPADVQKEVGYKTVVDRQMEIERTAQEQQLRETVQSQGRDEATKAARDQRLKAVFFASPTATQTEADGFAGMTVDGLREKLGEPVRVVQNVDPGGGSSTYFYDERKTTRTFFVIRNGETKISSGIYKGVVIRRP